MKRYLTIVLAGLLVAGMTLPVYAADIKATGQVRVRFRDWNYLTLDEDVTPGPDRQYFDNRTRLGVDAKLAEGVRARIELEKYFDFGNVGPNSALSPGSAGLATIGGTPQEPYFRQAWIDFAIPGTEQSTPWRVQAGRSFFSVGHQFIWGNSLTGEDGITFYGPLGPGDLKLRFAMPQNSNAQDGGRGRLGDNELTMLAADYKFEVAPKQNLEVYFIYAIDKQVTNYATLGYQDSNEFWLGGAYSGAAGPVALRAEFTYQGGTAREEDVGLGLPEIDRNAFFLYVDANYKIVPEWTIGLDISYASGDDDTFDTSDPSGLDDEFENFVAPLASFTSSPNRVWTDSGFFFGNRTGRAIGNAATNRNFSYVGRGGTEDTDAGSIATLDDNGAAGCAAGAVAVGPCAFSPGLIVVKFKTKYVVNPEVTVWGNLAFNWADATDSGLGSGGSADSFIGTEIDGKVGWRPYPNLVINGYLGYFLPGDFFEQDGALETATRAATPATGLSPNEDDAWVLRGEAVVTF